MNKVFKIIWNHATQSLVVVSELTKSKGKSSRSTDKRASLGSVVLTAVSVATGMSTMIGGAEAAIASGCATTQLYSQNNAASSLESGTNITTSGANNVVVGKNINMSQISSVAVGVDLKVNGTTKNVAVGTNSTASGNNSTLLGIDAVSKGDFGITIGMEAKSSEFYSTAIGYGANATGRSSIALGMGTKTANEGSIAMGLYSQATACASMALGYTATATGNFSTALGRGATATGINAIAQGYYAKATANDATAIGGNANASGQKASAIGPGATASSWQSTAIGTNANVSGGGNSVAIGTNSKSTGTNVNSMGTDANASADGANAIGNGAAASAVNATAIGTSSEAKAENATAVGTNANASAENSTSIGTNSEAKAENSTAIGTGANASAENSTAIGTNTTANSTNTISIGNSSIASKDGSTAIGNNANASGENATAIGTDSTANSTDSIAIGTGTTAAGSKSIAIGTNNTIGANANGTVVLGNNIAVTERDAGAVILGDNSSTQGSERIIETDSNATINNVTYEGFKGQASGNGRYVSVGSVGNERKIINVAAAAITANSTEAVNGSQLYIITDALSKAIDGYAKSGWVIKNNSANASSGSVESTVNIGDIVTFNNGTATTAVACSTDGSNFSVTYNVNAGKGLHTNSTSNTLEANVANVVSGGSEISVTNASGVFTVKANTTAMTTNNNGTISPTTGTALVNGTTVANAINNASWTLQENNVTKDNVTAGNVVNFVNGTGTTVNISTTNGNVSTVKVDVSLSGISTNVSFNTTNGTTTTSDSEKVVKAGDIVNAINNATTYVVAKGMNFAGNNGTTIHKDLGETLNITGTLANATAASARNVRVDSENGNLVVKIAETPVFTGVSLNNGSNVVNMTADASGLNLTTNGAAKKISGVANGTISSTSRDAINGSQLYALENNITNLVGNTSLTVTNGAVATPATADAAKFVNATTLANTFNNVSWALQENGTEKDDVKAADTINFVNGNGTTVAITTTNGNVSNISLNVNAGNGLKVNATTKALEANVTNVVGGNGVNVTSNSSGVFTISVDSSKLDTGNVTTSTSETGKVVLSPNSTTEGAKLVNATTVVDAINKSGWVVTSGNTTGGVSSNATNELVNPGDTVKFIAGKNLNVTQAGGNFTFALNDNLNISTLVANGTGGTSVSLDGNNGTIGINGKDGTNATITIANSTGTVSTADGNGNATRITYTETNSTTGTTITREVATLDDGLVFTGDNGVKVNRTLGSTLNVTGGVKDEASLTDDNIGVLANATTGALEIKLAKNLNLTNTGSVKVGNTTLVDTGLSITNGTNVANLTANADGFVVSKNGDAAKISGVANGTISATSTDAINGSQLYALQNNVTNFVGNTTLTVTNGAVATPSATEGVKFVNATTLANTFNNVSWTLQENGVEKDKVKAADTVNFVNGTGTTATITTTNDNVSNVSINVNTGNGLKLNTTTNAIELDGANASTAGIGVNSNGNGTVYVTPAGSGGQLVNATTVVNAINNSGWVATSGNTTGGVSTNATRELVNPGDTVKFIAGKNLNVTQAGGNFTFALNDNLNISTLVANGTDGKSVSLDGNNGTIGINGKDANTSITVTNGTGTVSTADGNGNATRITYTDTNSTGATITREVATLDDGLVFTGDNSVKVNRTLGSTLNVTGGADTANLTNNNIGVIANATTGALEIKLAKNLNLTNTGSITIGNTTLADAGLTITNGPSVTQSGIDAGSKVITNVSAGVNATDAVNVSQLKDSLNNASVSVVKGGNGIAVTNNTVGNTTTYTVAIDTSKLDTANITINPNANGTVIVNPENGGSKLVNATTVVDAINSAGWNLVSANTSGGVSTSTGSQLINPGKTVTLTAGKNLVVDQEGGNVTFSLNDNLNISTLIAGQNGANGTDGSIGATGKDGSSATLNGANGTITLDNKAGNANATIGVATGNTTVSEKDNGQGITRIVYNTTDSNGTTVTRQVATLDDGLTFTGDNGVTVNRTLGSDLKVVGGANVSNLTDNNIGVVADANGTLAVKLSKDLNLTANGSVTIGNTTLNNNGLSVVGANGTVSVTQDGISAGNNRITNVSEAVNGTDAVNLNQLQKFVTNATATTGLTNSTTGLISVDPSDSGSKLVNASTVANAINNAGWNVQAAAADGGNVVGNTTSLVKNGSTVTLAAGKNLNVTQDGANFTFSLNDNLNVTTLIAGQNGANGTDGSIGATGKDGSSATLNGKDGTITLDNKAGNANATIGVATGNTTVSEKDNGQGITRIVYNTTDSNGTTVTRQVATLDDGLTFTGDNGVTVNRTLGSDLKVVGGANVSNLADNNIGVVANSDGSLTVKLSKDVDLTKDGSVVAGNTTVDNSGLSIKDGPSITQDGIDMAGKKMTNVANGTVSSTSTEAVNGSQLNQVAQGWSIKASNVSGSNGVVTNATTAQVKSGEDTTVTIAAGNNVEITQDGTTLQIATSANPTFNTVKVGGTTVTSSGVTTTKADGTAGPSITNEGIDAANTRITKVAPGVADTDAVNVSQLKQAAGNINNQINTMAKDLNAGIAGAMAAGGLYHVTLPGKSMISAGVGAFRGENGLAVGYSRMSDNGKVGIKFSVNTNSRGSTGAAASVGYQW